MWMNLTRSAALTMLLAASGSWVVHVAGQDNAPNTQPDAPAPDPAKPDKPAETAAKKGLILSTSAAFQGYTLFAPQRSTTTYLVDMEGKVAHTWPSQYTPGESVYLLDDGSVLRTGRDTEQARFHGGGIGGRVERIAPDGKVVWSYTLADDKRCLHHDIEPMPNGHVLMIAWEKKTRDEAIAAGRDPQRLPAGELWPDSVLEIAPEGTDGGKIVWEWHVWDHLVQSHDKSMSNYGVIAEHPERIDLNYNQEGARETPADIARLKAIGYIGGDDEEEEDAHEAGPHDGADRDAGSPPRGPGGPGMQPDMCHTNSVAYHPAMDLIILSVHHYNEIWVIDHSTTAAESAGHSGGRHGKGGDLLYRWGNPRAHGAGSARDQRLFAQHDARWIPAGSPGAGHVMLFNNGMGRPDGRYSSVLELELPLDPNGRFVLEKGKPFGPAKPAWEYTAPEKTSFFSSHISGAERLPNGNTIICAGEQGRFFEVTAGGQTVWEYLNPFTENVGPPGGPGGPGRRGGPGMFPPGPPGDGSAERPDGPPAKRGEGRPPRGDRPRRPGPPGGFGPGGPGGGPSGGPGPWGPLRGLFGPGPGGMGSGVFRASRYPVDHPGVRKALDAAKAKPRPAEAPKGEPG